MPVIPCNVYKKMRIELVSNRIEPLHPRLKAGVGRPILLLGRLHPATTSLKRGIGRLTPGSYRLILLPNRLILLTTRL